MGFCLGWKFRRQESAIQIQIRSRSQARIAMTGAQIRLALTDRYRNSKGKQLYFTAIPHGLLSV
jgi:hypothetical protein